MTHTLYIIHPYGKVEVQAHVKPTLEVLQKAIGGGYIETVPGFSTYEVDGEKRRCRAYCDEDGISKRLDYNKSATELWAEQYKRRYHRPLIGRLLGRVVVVVKDR